MSFCDKLEAYLTKEGYAPEKTEFGLHFKFESLDFLHIRDEQDELFFNCFFPQIFKAEDDAAKADVLEALNNANLQMKCAKGAIHPDGFVWVGVESLLSDNYDLDDVLHKALNMMKAYRDVFYHNYSQTPSGQAAMAAAQQQA
ncbi:MAG: YbjN domain-containing protein [Bacteroidaceae bacterium]|nr:YbjN domain-containing protein [Bacteroidaceae bacterium]